MKKIIILMLGVLLATFTGCKKDSEEIIEVYVTPVWKGAFETAPANPQSGWAYYNTADKKSYVYNGSSWEVMSEKDESLSDFVYIGETKETVDNTEYTVKSYAFVYSELIYKYFKYYYSEGRLCREKDFNCDEASNYKTPYTEFSESEFIKNYNYKEYVYYPSGKIQFDNFYTAYGSSIREYSEDGKEKKITEFNNGVKVSERIYYKNNIVGNLSYNRENGTLDYERYYQINETYNIGEDILSVSYNDGSLYSFYYNDKDKDFARVYLWINGTLTTYGENDEPKEEAYSEEKALELIETLRPKE